MPERVSVKVGEDGPVAGAPREWEGCRRKRERVLGGIVDLTLC